MGPGIPNGFTLPYSSWFKGMKPIYPLVTNCNYLNKALQYLSNLLATMCSESMDRLSSLVSVHE